MNIDTVKKYKIACFIIAILITILGITIVSKHVVLWATTPLYIALFLGVREFMKFMLHKNVSRKLGYTSNKIHTFIKSSEQKYDGIDCIPSFDELVNGLEKRYRNDLEKRIILLSDIIYIKMKYDSLDIDSKSESYLREYKEYTWFLSRHCKINLEWNW